MSWISLPLRTRCDATYSVGSLSLSVLNFPAALIGLVKYVRAQVLLSSWFSHSQTWYSTPRYWTELSYGSRNWDSESLNILPKALKYKPHESKDLDCYLQYNIPHIWKSGWPRWVSKTMNEWIIWVSRESHLSYQVCSGKSWALSVMSKTGKGDHTFGLISSSLMHSSV